MAARGISTADLRVAIGRNTDARKPCWLLCWKCEAWGGGQNARRSRAGRFSCPAVEISFSEEYKHLMKDMKHWLQGSKGKVRVILLVNVIEIPKVWLIEAVLEVDFDAGPAAIRG